MSPWRSASPPRCRCSGARCWSATRCAAACAIWCCRGSAGLVRSSRLRASSGRRSRRIYRNGAAAAPLIATRGFITHEASQRRASSVLVYGVDERFWRFHGLEPRDGVFVSPALGAELGAAPGDVLLTRLQKPSEIPLESLFAHKEDLGRTIRLTVTGLLPRGRSLASSRFNRSRRKFAPCSRRCHGCSAILRSAGRSTPCWSPARSPRPTRRGRSDPA